MEPRDFRIRCSGCGGVVGFSVIPNFNRTVFHGWECYYLPPFERNGGRNRYIRTLVQTTDTAVRAAGRLFGISGQAVSDMLLDMSR